MSRWFVFGRASAFGWGYREPGFTLFSGHCQGGFDRLQAPPPWLPFFDLGCD